MKDIIEKSPKACLKVIFEFLPKLHFKLLEEQLLKQYQRMDKLLSRSPTDVADFCEIKKYIMEAEDDLEALGEKYNKIGELEMIMQENNIKMPDKNNSAIKEVSFVKNSCREKLSMGRDTIEAVQPMYVKKLEKKVPELEKKVKDI